MSERRWLTSLPVNDAFAVQEEEAYRNLRCVEPGGGERKGVCVTVGGCMCVPCFIFQKIGKGFQQRMEPERLMKGEVTR